MSITTNFRLLIAIFHKSKHTGTNKYYYILKMQVLSSRFIFLHFLIYFIPTVFHLRNKKFFQCFHSLVKTEVNVWENSRADQRKLEMQSRVFTCSRILTNFVEHFFVLHSTIKAPLFQSKCTNYPNYFINSFEMKQPRIQISRRHGKNGLLVVPDSKLKITI